jgi:hypothetical protein
MIGVDGKGYSSLSGILEIVQAKIVKTCLGHFHTEALNSLRPASSESLNGLTMNTFSVSERGSETFASPPCSNLTNLLNVIATVQTRFTLPSFSGEYHSREAVQAT